MHCIFSIWRCVPLSSIFLLKKLLHWIGGGWVGTRLRGLGPQGARTQDPRHQLLMGRPEGGGKTHKSKTRRHQYPSSPFYKHVYVCPRHVHGMCAHTCIEANILPHTSPSLCSHGTPCLGHPSLLSDSSHGIFWTPDIPSPSSQREVSRVDHDSALGVLQIPKAFHEPWVCMGGAGET